MQVDTAAAAGTSEDVADVPEAGASVARRRVSFEELEFDPSMLDQDLIHELVPGFAWLQGQADSTEDPLARQSALAGLEQRLMDSIDARSAAQRAWSVEHPEDSAIGAARLARLERLKNERRAAALASTEAPAGNPAIPEPEQSEMPVSSQVAASPAQEDHGPVPPAALALAAARAYEEAITFPSAEMAVQQAWMDSARSAIRSRQAELDSMQGLLTEQEDDQERARLQKALDDRSAGLLALKVDLGRRSGQWLPQLYMAAMDSLRTRRSLAAGKAVPAEAPLMRAASALEDSAQQAMARAEQWRALGQAAASDTVRDQWYGMAWSAGVRAFRQLDSAATMWNYLLLPGVDPAAAVSYAEVEGRLAAGAEQNTASQAPDQAEPMAEQMVPPAPSSPGVNAGSARTGSIVAEAVPADTASTIASDAVVPVSAETAPPMQDTLTAASGTGSQATALPAFLDRRYRLTAETRSMLDADREAKAYLVLQGSAMQHADSARSILAMANTLTGQAAAAHMEAAAVRSSNTAEAVRIEARARALDARSDSLRFLALKQDHAAHLDHAAAQHLLEELPTARSTAITSLESSVRRTEVPQLAAAFQANTAVETSGSPVRQPVPVGHEVVSSSGSEVASNVDPVVPVVTTPAVVGAGSGARVDTVLPLSEVPPPAVVPPAQPEIAVLAGHLVADRFDWMPEGSRRTAPIPVDVAKPGGVVYSVQIGAFRNALPMDAFTDLSPVSGERMDNGLTRYTAGLFTSAESAAKAGEAVRSRGYRDAFVVAYLDGRRVSLRDALAAERGAPRPALPEVPPVAMPAIASAVPPAPVDSLPGGTEGATLLTKYPATAAEVLASFKPDPAASAYYADPAAAPAKQVETVKGLFFTVQVGVYSKPTPLDRLFNITPLNSERTANGKIRYTTGVFPDPASAGTRKDATVVLGVKDAFVTAYINGVRIPLTEGRALLRKFGSAVLVDPGMLTR